MCVCVCVTGWLVRKSTQYLQTLHTIRYLQGLLFVLVLCIVVLIVYYGCLTFAPFCLQISRDEAVNKIRLDTEEQVKGNTSDSNDKDINDSDAGDGDAGDGDASDGDASDSDAGDGNAGDSNASDSDGDASVFGLFY